MTGILLLDKDPGMSSQKCVFKVRALTGARKAGHGGTLDPMASGLLPILLGNATKLSEFLLTGDKEYVAGVRFGVETDTLDVTGQVLAETPCRPTKEELEEALPFFTGEILQTPPMYSALSVGGEKLYRLARQGIEVERRPRSVAVHRLTLCSFTGEEAVLAVSCSKGTYIRSLIADLGHRLGCGACMSSLRRTASAGFHLRDAHTLTQLEEAAEEGRLEELVISPEDLFLSLPAAETSSAFYYKLLWDGQRVLQKKLGTRVGEGELVRWTKNGRFVGLLREIETEEGSALAAVWRGEECC
ncbi:MAG: tRNA pseudouridine(55) synthase TruB [Clostridia bacterium]|nr:tRNA pseudouridine(55) synthase TruB [Clostridia bacterium]